MGLLDEIFNRYIPLEGGGHADAVDEEEELEGGSLDIPDLLKKEKEEDKEGA